MDSVSLSHLLYIRILEKLTRYLDALDFVRKCLKHHPSHYYLHHSEGNLLMHHLKFSQAIGSFDKVIELRPQFQLSWYNKALCQQRVNRPLESLQTLSQLEIILSEKEWAPRQDVFNAMGQAYIELNSLDKAENHFREALKITDRQDLSRRKLFISNLASCLFKA